MKGFERAPDALRCTSSGRRYPIVGGVVDFVPGVGGSREPAQRLMEQQFYTTGYERLFRPGLTRLVSTQSLEAAIELSLAMVEVPRTGAVLDIGCGTGNFTRPLAARLDPTRALVVGLDLSMPMLQRAEQTRRSRGLAHVRHVRGDAQRLPVDDAVLDAVHCAASLQLMPDPWAALSEMARVLRPGGRLVLGTFIRSPRPSVRRMQQVLTPFSGFRWFDPIVLLEQIESCGLRVCEEMVEGAAITIAAVREEHTTTHKETP